MKRLLIAGAIPVLAAVLAWSQTPGTPDQNTSSSQNPATTTAPSSNAQTGNTPQTATTAPSAANNAGSIGAETTSQTGGNSVGSGETAGGSSGQVIQGCLGGSSGSYTLTQVNGSVYTLDGSDDQLNQHVGQEVQVTGSLSATPGAAGSRSASTTANNSANSSPSSPSNTGGSTANVGSMKVNSVSKVSDHCTGASGAGPVGSPSAVNRPGDQLKVDAVSKASIPAPLVGLLGFGFMIAGLAAGRNRRISD